MKINRKMENEIAELKIQGRLWQESDSTELLNIVDDTISNGFLKIIVDLSDVPIMNSSGLGSLIAMMKKVQTASGRLALTGVNDRLMNLLRITKLMNIFSIYPSRDEALTYLTAG